MGEKPWPGGRRGGLGFGGPRALARGTSRAGSLLSGSRPGTTGIPPGIYPRDPAEDGSMDGSPPMAAVEAGRYLSGSPRFSSIFARQSLLGSTILPSARSPHGARCRAWGPATLLTRSRHVYCTRQSRMLITCFPIQSALRGWTDLQFFFLFTFSPLRPCHGQPLSAVVKGYTLCGLNQMLHCQRGPGGSRQHRRTTGFCPSLNTASLLPVNHWLVYIAEHCISTARC